MLGSLRRLAATWPARIFFGLLIISFGFWGVGDMVRNLGVDHAAAHVAGTTISPQTLASAYQQDLNRITLALRQSAPPSPALKVMIADQTLRRLVAQAALDATVRRLGIRVPPAVLRQHVYAMPGFAGPGGGFDRTLFDQALASHNLTETMFLASLRTTLAERQLLHAASAGMTPPALLTRAIFASARQQRVAEMVRVPFNAAPIPASPAPGVITRWWQNHPGRFSTPEYRRVRIVILSPQTLAAQVQVSAAEIAAAYQADLARYRQPEKRGVEVLSTPDQAAAAALAAQWRAGADWATMQKAAAAKGASAIVLAPSTAAQFPSPVLAKAVFAALAGTVSAPVKTGLGYSVFRVSQVVPGKTTSLAAATPALRQRLALATASRLVDHLVGKVQDALAGGTSLSKLPPALDLAGLEGTFDRQGMTPEGKKAPIPGPAGLAARIVARAFTTPPGQPPQLLDGPGDSYFALTVHKIIPAAPRPLAQARAQVLADWLRHAMAKSQERVATALYVAAKNGGSLKAAVAALHGRYASPVFTTPPLGRAANVPSVPADLVKVLFTLHPGQATMIEVPGGFVVAKLTRILTPDPAREKARFARLRAQIAAGMARDVQNLLVSALTRAGHPRVNHTILEQIAGQ